MSSSMMTIRTSDNRVVASSAVPAGYACSGIFSPKMKHERVPFTVLSFVQDYPRKIRIYAMSDEMFTTYKNPVIKKALRQVPGILWDSVRDFIDPWLYVKETAEYMAEMRLTETARATLPSVFDRNLRKKLADFRAEYDVYFQYEAMGGAPTYPQNVMFRSILSRYTGEKDGIPFVVYAGVDYKGIEYYTTAPTGYGMFGMGGARQQAKGSYVFGEGSPCDAIEWGAENRFVLITPAEYEKEASSAFIDVVSTWQMEPSLRSEFIRLRSERAGWRLQQSLQYQQMANQARMNLQYQQQKLTRMLQENSQQISAGIMDSWNQKMASESRISQNYSEAVRGVNTYYTTDGRPVEVSVTADHVYENRYGDVYGVSGAAPDQETLNRLNWTEL